MSQGWEKELMAGELSTARISREFDFPRESVFDMFTDSRKAAKWWGPEGSTNLAFELDPRPGGALVIHDRNSEGAIFKTLGTIVEIVIPELLVFRTTTTSQDGAAPFEAMQRVTFEALTPKRTRVTALVRVLAVGSWPGDADSLKEAFKGGWTETLQRLQEAMS